MTFWLLYLLSLVVALVNGTRGIGLKQFEKSFSAITWTDMQAMMKSVFKRLEMECQSFDKKHTVGNSQVYIYILEEPLWW